MSIAKVPSDVAVSLAKALGLDPGRTSWLELRVAVGEVISVKVCRWVTTEELQELTSVLEDYQLVKREEEKP
jgi:hypothetical protein